MLYLIFGLVLAGLSCAVSRNVPAAVLSFVSGTLVSYCGLPTLQWGFWGVAGFLAFGGMITLFCQAVMERRLFGSVVFTLAPIAVTAIAALLLSFGPFHWTAYRDQIGTITERNYSTDTAPIDASQIRVVDEEVARRLADKKLGEQTALGSLVNLGAMSIQNVNGRLYWVAPLDHASFFRWLKHRRGTPGYVMVSATNEQDVRLVQTLNGDSIRLRYNFGSRFGDYPVRYLYENGYATTGLGQFSFEIDDSGRPFYVVPRFEKKVGFGGADAVGVITLDAQTGEIQSYGIDDAPAWIDRIQPESFVVKQLNNWGRYINGGFLQNPSCTGCLQATEGISLVYGDDGRSYWYTGLRSRGSDDATVGFVLVDTRTKETRYYKQAGATETAAMESAAGAVQEKGYSPSFPIMYNVGGQPTYFVTLKDNAGLVKAMAFVSVENYQIVGLGTDQRSALRNYRRALSTRGNAVAPTSSTDLRSVTGTVARFASEIKEGNTYLYIVVDSEADKALVGTAGLSAELLLTKVGDSVTVTFESNAAGVVDLLGFDNLELDFPVSRAQDRVDAYTDSVRAEDRERRVEQNADAAREELSAEDKAALISQSGSVS